LRSCKLYNEERKGEREKEPVAWICLGAWKFVNLTDITPTPFGGNGTISFITEAL